MTMLESGSIEWSIDGEIYRASATIVSEMKDAYQSACERGERQKIKFAMDILIQHGIIKNTKREKDMSWHEVAKAVGHEK